jgi:peptidyl-prolyl cis-trans isomerase D
MSVLQTLREKAGPLVAGVIGLSLLIFVVSDFFDSNSSQRRRAKKYYELATIDDESITYQDFETKVQEMVDIYKMSGNSNISEEMATNIREQIWQQMVMEKIYGKTIDKTGLAVTADEVDALVLGNDPHPIVKRLFTDPNTGVFNKSYMVNFLKATETDEATKKYWLFFENQIISERLNSKLINLMSKGVYVTTSQAEFESNISGQTVNFSFMSRNYSSLSDSAVKVSKDEITKYYDNHQKSFKRSASRDMEYVTFPIVPSETDKNEVKAWAEKIKPEFIEATDIPQFINLNSDTRYTGVFLAADELPENLKTLAQTGDKSYVSGPYFDDESYKLARIIKIEDRPDSVRVRHILISPKAAGSTARARIVADSLMTLIKRGVDFGALATANSVDENSAQVGGDLGWFHEGAMMPSFSNPCFEGKKGDLFTAETNYGVHIISIIDQSRKVKKYDIGVVDRKIIPSNVTNQQIYAEASKFAGNNNTWDKFNKTVASGNLNKKVAAAITPEQKELPGLNQPRSLLMALYQTKEAGSIVLDNNNQAIFELPDMYVVAYCTKIQEEGVAPINAVSAEIRFKLAKEKKAEKISAEMAKYAEGKTLYDVASNYRTQVLDATGISFRSYSVQGAGVEPALIAAAACSPQGVLSKPVEGNNGVYMFVVNTITPAAKEDIATLKTKLNSNYQVRASYEAYQALREKKDVVDERYKFY